MTEQNGKKKISLAYRISAIITIAAAITLGLFQIVEDDSPSTAWMDDLGTPLIIVVCVGGVLWGLSYFFIQRKLNKQ